MREEHKLNKAIKQNGVKTQSEILDELKYRYPQYVEQSGKSRVNVKKRKTAVIFAFAAAAVCAAIVVPCAVLLSNKNNDNNDGNEDRYCGIDDYRILYDVDYTIEEYREDNNRNFLYFDWYEFGEDCNTVSYISNSDNEVLCLEEDIYLPQTDEFVQLSITKANVYLSAFEPRFESCNKEYTVYNHMIKWSINKDRVLCIFEDSGYRYFIQIKFGQDENRLFELVAELLETK